MNMDVEAEVDGHKGTEKDYVDKIIRSNEVTGPERVNVTSKEEIERTTSKLLLTILFLNSSERQRYGNVNWDLTNYHTLKKYNYLNQIIKPMLYWKTTG